MPTKHRRRSSRLSRRQVERRRLYASTRKGEVTKHGRRGTRWRRRCRCVEQPPDCFEQSSFGSAEDRRNGYIRRFGAPKRSGGESNKIKSIRNRFGENGLIDLQGFSIVTQTEPSPPGQAAQSRTRRSFAIVQSPAPLGIAIADAPVGVYEAARRGHDGPRIHHIAR